MTLRKRLNGLGFSFFITELDTSLDCGTIVRIRTLFPGQPAEKSGQIQQGDVILSINGESLKGLSSQVMMVAALYCMKDTVMLMMIIFVNIFLVKI